MPIDEEQPSVALQITDASKRMLQEKILSSAFAGALSLIPGVGGAVIEMMTELAIQRVDNRVNEMFGHFTNRMREAGEDKVDREWFRSEEFQTLLFEAFHQLHVTHDREKIEMLRVDQGERLVQASIIRIQSRLGILIDRRGSAASFLP